MPARPVSTLPVMPLLFAVGLAACAPKQAILGSVHDRNGTPVPRAIVALNPGNVELITNAEGGFTIDYQRDDEGRRKPLDTRTSYTVEVLKPGYHASTSQFYFKRGTLTLDTITLLEDTIEVSPSEGDLDPNQHPDRSQSEGSTYEGE